MLVAEIGDEQAQAQHKERGAAQRQIAGPLQAGENQQVTGLFLEKAGASLTNVDVVANAVRGSGRQEPMGQTLQTVLVQRQKEAGRLVGTVIAGKAWMAARVDGLNPAVVASVDALFGREVNAAAQLKLVKIGQRLGSLFQAGEVEASAGGSFLTGQEAKSEHGQAGDGQSKDREQSVGEKRSGREGTQPAPDGGGQQQGCHHHAGEFPRQHRRHQGAPQQAGQQNRQNPALQDFHLETIRVRGAIPAQGELPPVNPIQPKRISAPPCGAPLRNLSPLATPPSGDKVELSGLKLPEVPNSPPPGKPPKSLTRRLLKWAGIATLGVTAGTSILGGIAYQGNHQALLAPTVHVYPQQLEQPATPSLARQVQSVPAPAAETLAKAPPPGVQILIPSGTVEQWINSPKLQAQISNQLSQAQGKIQQQIGQVRVPSGQVLLDVTLPMPTSNQSFLHVGGLNLPSLGYQALQTEAVPLQVDYRADTLETGLKVDVQQLREAPGQGPGVWLGGVKVTVSAPEGYIPVAGEVNLALDLQGQSTRAQIERLRKMPGQERLIQQLQARLDQGQRLQRIIQEQGLDNVLEAGLNQDLAFQGKVLTGKEPLVQTSLHVWAVPDRTGDGKADLQVTQQNQLDNLRNLRVQVDEIGGDSAPSGMIDKFVHDQARQALISNLEKQIPQLDQQIQQTALDQVGAQLRSQAGQIQAQANGQLHQLYARDPQIPGLGSVQQIKVGPGGVLLELPGQQGGDGLKLAPGALQSGQVAVGIDRTSLNQQLKQRVDWDQILQKAGGTSFKMSWARDAQNRPVHPELRSRDGKLFMHVEINAQRNLLPGQKPGLLDNISTALDIPLQFKTDQGKLVVHADLQGAELQSLKAGGLDLSKLVPASAITKLVGDQALGQTVDPAGWGGARFDRVQVSPGGDLTVVVGTTAATVDWASQALK